MTARAIAAASLALATMLAAARASGAESEASKVACKAAYESAQVLKREERYGAAQKQIAVCRETCPAPIVRECASWKAEIEALTPTLRLSVIDAAGHPLTGARLLLDGHALVERNGAVIAVDPGAHVLRAESADAAGETRFTVGVGERDRVVAVAVETPTRTTLATSPPSPSLPSRVPSYVAFGAGGIFLLTGGVLAVKGHLDKSSLRSSCAPSCDESDVDRIRTTWWIGAGAAGVGVVALAVGYLLWPSSSTVVRVGLREISLTWALP